MSFVSKGDSNEFHGNTFEFLCNEKLGAKRARPFLKQHDFGATIGGPVSITNTYNSKNKSFLFVA